MANFLERIFGRNNSKGSGAEARDRLQFILVHDRISISPELMRAMKQEILDVIVRYLPEVDLESVDLVVEQSDRNSNMLIAQIPFNKQPGSSSLGAMADDKPRDASFPHFDGELESTAEMETMSYEMDEVEDEEEEDEDADPPFSDEDTLPNRRSDDSDEP
ncbi:MAG: cell division topological specificity factor MinE [Anaerolineae bacterium]|nr:cell division topological specificity factor MinE [Anaerolineae bacterium]